MQKDVGPLIVEIEKRPEADFGLRLRAESRKLDSGVVRIVIVENIIPASTADRLFNNFLLP